ncbi:hypothetical protein M3I54_01190 [Paraburkholderia sp. CNPSo 3274]|nr:hypothetical protein [Paraburkholderia sp. CNPSo 3274]
MVATSVALGAATLWLLGQHKGSLEILTPCVFFAGACLNGATVSMAALGASTYPTSGRTTGISWMNGVGRFGGMLGPLIGGLILRHDLAVGTMFALLAVPALIQAAALWLKRSVQARFTRLEYPGSTI